jgi:hypothetical protein
MRLSSNISFVKGAGKKKYKAILPNGKTVSFGHVDYEHYKDSVPKKLGGGLWSHKNHGDSNRRTNYRKRHAGMMCSNGTPCYKIRHSPSWFSYYFLW